MSHIPMTGRGRARRIGPPKGLAELRDVLHNNRKEVEVVQHRSHTVEGAVKNCWTVWPLAHAVARGDPVRGLEGRTAQPQPTDGRKAGFVFLFHAVPGILAVNTVGGLDMSPPKKTLSRKKNVT